MLSGKDTQIAAFLGRLPNTPATDDGVSPRVLFPGDLVLTREQEEKMIDWALKRKQQLSDELGRDEVMDNTSISVPENGDIDGMKWLPKLALLESIFEQKVDWRRTVLKGIYAEGQNIHMPMLRRICNQMISRALNYFFGSDPWFGATPIGEDDQVVAQNLDQFTKYKLEKGGVKGDLERGVRKAMTLGTQIVKTRHWTDAVFYETTDTIAIDQQSGQPLLAHDGDYITQADVWIDAAAPPPASPDAAPLAPAGDPAAASLPVAGVKVLKRDPSTSYPEGGLVWNKQRVRRKVVRYSGPEAKCVTRKDFLAPRDVEDLQLADCVVHLYDVQALEIVDMYLMRLQKQGQFDPAEWPKVMELLRNVSAETADPKAGANQPRQELGETSATSDGTKAGDPTFECNEFYLLYDANEDGQYENIHLLLDPGTKTPISYDHLPNVFKDARRPFHDLCVNPEDGRWTGLGVAEILYQLQRFIDLVTNRWDMSISTSGAVTFWSPEHTAEGQTNPQLQLHGGKTYRKRDPKMKAEDIVERVWLHDFKGADLNKILEFGLQMMTNLLGVGNVNDAAMAGMDTAQLATGVRNLEKSGQEQFAPYISHLEKGILSVAQACAKLAVWHMDPREAFNVNENNALSHLVVEADAIQALEFDVNLELTRYRAEQAAAESAYAVGTVIEFYGLMPPLQLLLLPLYRQRLKAYGVKNPDKYLIPGQLFTGAPALPASTPPGQAPQGAAAVNAQPGSPPNL